MVSREMAISIARDFLNGNERLTRLKPVLLEAQTTESKKAWVLFYDSETHLQTGDYRDAVAGAGPLFVDKLDGSVHSFGSAFPLQACIRVYDELRKSGAVSSATVLEKLREERLPAKE